MCKMLKHFFYFLPRFFRFIYVYFTKNYFNNCFKINNYYNKESTIWPCVRRTKLFRYDIYVKPIDIILGVAIFYL